MPQSTQSTTYVSASARSPRGARHTRRGACQTPSRDTECELACAALSVSEVWNEVKSGITHDDVRGFQQTVWRWLCTGMLPVRQLRERLKKGEHPPRSRRQALELNRRPSQMSQRLQRSQDVSAT